MECMYIRTAHSAGWDVYVGINHPCATFGRDGGGGGLLRMGLYRELHGSSSSGMTMVPRTVQADCHSLK